MEEAKGEIPDGQRFEGSGIAGCDNIKKEYTSVWVDNMSTMIMATEGTCDESGKVLTYSGEYPDPITDKTVKTKSVLRIVNHDRHVVEMYQQDPDGKEFKSMEITYTRR